MAAPVGCVVTMATAECLSEFGLLHASLRAFHPDLHIVLGTTTDALDRLRTKSSSEAPHADMCLELARSALRTDSQLTCLPVLDQYGAVNRRRMERAAGTWYASRHCDFMMEKANLLDWALQRGFASALFVDSDITMLRPLPVVPSAAAVGVAPHRIRRVDERLFGTYNGGWLYVRDPSAIFEWRRATHSSRYFDQASIEDVAERFGTACHVFDATVNYGYWRMFQTEAGPEAEAKRFRVAPQQHAVLLDGQPLQSVHTHLAMPTSCKSTRVFNRVIASWARQADIAARWPSWKPVGDAVAKWSRVTQL
jgi:hypothetical protein